MAVVQKHLKCKKKGPEGSDRGMQKETKNSEKRKSIGPSTSSTPEDVEGMA